MKKKEYISQGRIPSDWHERVLVLWEEDDATLSDPSAEKPEAALARIGGLNQAVLFRCRLDMREPEGCDYWLELYEGGWVLGHTPSGGFVGCVIAKEKP
jgi:hypothetical protein